MMTMMMVMMMIMKTMINDDDDNVDKRNPNYEITRKHVSLDVKTLDPFPVKYHFIKWKVLLNDSFDR